MIEGFATLLNWDGGLSLLPPVVAVLLAWITRRVVFSLLAAAFTAAAVATQGDLLGTPTLLVETLWGNLTDPDNATITAFSVAVAATVGVLGRSGGTRALVARVERVATDRRRSMVATWLAGAVVFFDDYANCLVVGSSMGPLCDRHGVSRAKLAYIVDATAAPIASVALVSTWIGYEVGLVSKELEAVGSELVPFAVFLEAVPYRFYCLLTLAFVGAVAITGRDFGSMYRLEAEVRPKPAPEADEASAPALWVGLLPILTLVFGVFGLLVGHGVWNLGGDLAGRAPFEILDAANPFLDMAVGASLALVAAFATGSAAGVSAPDLGRAAWAGTKAVGQALVVLYLAWTLGSLIKQTGAAPFLASLLEGRLPPELLPLATFVLAGLTAFGTGSSYFTMGTLIPLVLPLALQLDPTGGPIVLASMAAVLDGAVLGDHISPISDTTILSSLGAGIDLMTHVRTQLPYALTVGGVAVAVCVLPAGFGVSPWLLVPLGMTVCVGVVRVVGRVPPIRGPAPAQP